MDIKNCLLKILIKFVNGIKVFLGLGIILLITYSVWYSYFQKDGDLVVALSVTLPPYSFYGTSTEKQKGFDYDMAYLIADRLHKNLKIKYMPFRNAVKELKAGTIDLICASMSITDERLHDVAMVHVYGGPTPYISMIFWNSSLYEELSWYSKDEVSIHTAKNVLKNASIGVESGKLWESLLKKYALKNVVTFNYEQDVIAALESGKIAAAVVGAYAAVFLSKQHPNIQELDIALDEPWSYGAGIAIKKDRIGLIKRVNDIVQEFKVDGVIDLHQQRWFRRIC